MHPGGGASSNVVNSSSNDLNSNNSNSSNSTGNSRLQSQIGENISSNNRNNSSVNGAQRNAMNAGMGDARNRNKRFRINEEPEGEMLEANIADRIHTEIAKVLSGDNNGFVEKLIQCCFMSSMMHPEDKTRLMNSALVRIKEKIDAFGRIEWSRAITNDMMVNDFLRLFTSTIGLLQVSSPWNHQIALHNPAFLLLGVCIHVDLDTVGENEQFVLLTAELAE